MDWWGVGRAVFFDPRGGTHFEGHWKPPEEINKVSPAQCSAVSRKADHGRNTRPAAGPLGSAETLIQKNRDRGVNPDGWTAGARWEREADIPDRIYFRAMEALGEVGGEGGVGGAAR